MTARRPLLVLALVLAWYNAGVEWLRAEKARITSVEDLEARWRTFVWPPWNALLTYVSQTNDEALYFQYSRRLLGEDEDRALVDALHHGNLGPHLGRETVEYPPLALTLMLAPRLFAHDLVGYRFVFGLLGTLLYALLWWLGWRATLRAAPPSDGRPLEAAALARRALFVTLALGPIFLRRLDVLPACLTVFALALVVSEREGWGGLVLGLGAGAKLYPLLLAPTWLALLAARPHGRRRALRFAAPLLLLGVVALVVRWAGHQAGSGGGAVAMMAERPFQLESFVGAVLAAVGGKGALVWSFGSRNVSLPWADPLARHFQVVLALGALAVALVAWRWRRAQGALEQPAEARALIDFTAAAVLVVLLTSKVLSAQYLVWTLPLLALGTRRAYRWLVATLAVTQLLYPALCDFLNQGSPPLVALLIARNLMLVAMLMVWLRDADQAGRSHMR